MSHFDHAASERQHEHSDDHAVGPVTVFFLWALPPMPQPDGYHEEDKVTKRENGGESLAESPFL